MKRAGLLLILSLSGCDDIPRARSESAIRGIAAEEAVKAAQRMDERVTQLEADNQRLQANVEILQRWVDGESKSLESLRKTFNRNVDAQNKAKVLRMTANGACGTERVDYPDGGWSTRNKECTLKDLLPPS